MSSPVREKHHHLAQVGRRGRRFVVHADDHPRRPVTRRQRVVQRRATALERCQRVERREQAVPVARERRRAGVRTESSSPPLGQLPRPAWSANAASITRSGAATSFRYSLVANIRASVGSESVDRFAGIEQQSCGVRHRPRWVGYLLELGGRRVYYRVGAHRYRGCRGARSRDAPDIRLRSECSSRV